VTLALGTRLVSNGGGGSVTPIDPPVLRRVLVTDQTEEPIVLEFNPGDPITYLCASLGTYDVISLEGGTLPINLLTEASDKFILTVN
jgi:hypothetical protein